MLKRIADVFVICMILVASFQVQANHFILNNPYPASQALQKIYYSSFSEQPKTLDPAKSYSANEYQFIAQIYEPILQYDYLARPYQLIPLTATEMPLVQHYDAAGQLIPDVQNTKKTVAKTSYTIQIKPGILYQPHPAFAKTSDGLPRFFSLTEDYLDEHRIAQLSDFSHSDTREVTVDDYIYEIKRLATPRNNSPIYGLMSDHIVGFREFAQLLPAQDQGFLDLRQYPLAGVKKLDKYTFQIITKGWYPQFIYWLAMPFFSPIPWEADRFYAQPGMDDKNLEFGWYPVGTGPFMLSKNNPNSHMVLEKNPNYRAEYFPSMGSKIDEEHGYLNHRGERLPLIDKAVYTLEKESIPRWNKFLQGYYDMSGVSTDSFEQAIQITYSGSATLSPEMKEKGMHLKEITDPSIFYLGFNMLDPVVGGRSERARKLRQAISIAVNYDEHIAIFFNGRGIPAQGPIPPGIFGYREGQLGINPYVYTWQHGQAKRRSIAYAKQLLSQAGYVNGRDPATGKPLMLHYDVPASGGPDDKEQLNWMRKQFAQLGIALNVRATLYNRFQEKIRTGNAQLFSWGWNADYPDPENFLFLLYGPNGKVQHGGENASNYNNKEFNRLFNLMKNRNNDANRQVLIDNMVAIVRHDAPWVWGVNTQSFILSQQWVSPIKTNIISLNTLKYMAIDVGLRHRLQQQWNQPILWPIALLLLGLIFLLLPFFWTYYKKQQCSARRSPL